VTKNACSSVVPIIAPVRPAEFVIFRIFQNTAETQT
jgi:hypothetical protein